MKDLADAISFISDIFSVAASGIAIFLFLFKRKEISSAFGILLNYTYQLSLSELKEKLERLNEYNAKDPEELETVVNIFHEIMGQIRGNDKLKSHFSEVLGELEKFTSAKSIANPEARKRSLVSELRERLRNINAENIDSMVGGRE